MLFRKEEIVHRKNDYSHKYVRTTFYLFSFIPIYISEKLVY